METTLRELSDQATPGPWSADDNSGCKNINAWEGSIMCTDGLAEEEEDLANARLICILRNLITTGYLDDILDEYMTLPGEDNG